MASPGLDSQQITSHRKTRLSEFEGEKDFSQVKKEAVRYLEILGFPGKAESFANCSEDFAVFHCHDCGNDFSAPITCGLRVCPSCRSRIRGRFVEELTDHIKGVKNSRHMVLTFPNLPPDATVKQIKEKVRELKDNFGSLRRRSYFDERVKGTIYGIEVKQVGNGYNIHLHCFLALEDWVKHPSQFDYNKIAEMWCEYFPDAEPSAQEFRQHRSNRTALTEVVSYATKGAYFESGEAMAKWVVATSGSRLIGRTGCFYDIELFREKKYLECPYCGSREVDYLGKWSELVRTSVASKPPPTINEIEGG
ncbi:MAG: protein rep [Candidatus Bipolaricaulota bacterium]